VGPGRCGERFDDRPSWSLRHRGTGIPALPIQLKEVTMSSTVLWIIAAILVIVGIVQLIQGQIILGIVLIVVGCVVGPGGYSIFRSRA
jgi:hypothetical protein